jgi:hypothetical protein
VCEKMCKTVNLWMSLHNLAIFWYQNAANAAAVRRLLSSLPHLTSALDCRLRTECEAEDGVSVHRLSLTMRLFAAEYS